MASGGCGSGTQTLSQTIHIRPGDREDLQSSSCQVRIKLCKHFGGFFTRKPLPPITRKAEDLKPNRLPKLKGNQRGDGERSITTTHQAIRLNAILLLAVDRTKQGGVRESDHPSSPSCSKAFISTTSRGLKTRAPQISRRWAAKSGQTISFCSEFGTRRAKGRPRREISTTSPFSIHAETWRK